MRFASRVAAVEDRVARYLRRLGPGPTEHARELLAAEPRGAAAIRWLAEAASVIGTVIDAPIGEIRGTAWRLAHTYAGGFGVATEEIVLRAALRRLADWGSLTEADLDGFSPGVRVIAVTMGAIVRMPIWMLRAASALSWT